MSGAVWSSQACGAAQYVTVDGHVYRLASTWTLTARRWRDRTGDRT